MYYHYYHHVGTLEVICGSMFSGKSEELIRRIKRANIAKQNTIVFKPTIDQRYHADHVSSHDGNHIKAINISCSEEILDYINDSIDVVGIDEVQFLQGDTISTIQTLIKSGKRVICAGLDMDFRGEPFGVVPHLLAIADDVTKLSAICMVCGHPAHFTQRLVNGEPAHIDDPLILIGAKESYEARCRNCYRLGGDTIHSDSEEYSMNTIIIPNNQNQDLSLAAHVLQQGGLVAMPTETVYGLAANALDSKAVGKIFKAKGRPSDNPLIVHIGDITQINNLVTNITPSAKALMNAFWPGPLTLVFDASDAIPPIVSAGLSTVAIRFPSHPIAQKLINTSGLVLAAPSANTSGKPSPTTAGRVIEDLGGKIEVIIDGGRVEVGLESTVVDVTKDIPIILRPGKITKEMLENVVGEVSIDPALSMQLQDSNFAPKAPGMKYAHYSPNALVCIIEGDSNDVIKAIDTLAMQSHLENKKVGIMATDETISYYTKGDITISLGSKSDLETIAHSLFETLRAFDDAKVDIIYTESFPNEGLGIAIMNRLTKAANNNIVCASSIGGSK